MPCHKRVGSFDWRVTLTDDPSNMVPLPEPEAYNPGVHAGVHVHAGTVSGRCKGGRGCVHSYPGGVRASAGSRDGGEGGAIDTTG